MDLSLTTASGKKSTKSLEVSSDVFDVPFNEPLVHQVVVSYLSGLRQGTKGQKNRAAVSGGGAKPWRQKGTGRARAGTIRSPLWRGGGVTFAGGNENHCKKVNKKEYRYAIKSILSELVRQGRLIVVEKMEVESCKTKGMVEKLSKLGLSRDVLVVVTDLTEELYLAARNLIKINVCDVFDVDPALLVGHEHIVMTSEAVKYFEEQLG